MLTVVSKETLKMFVVGSHTSNFNFSNIVNPNSTEEPIAKNDRFLDIVYRETNTASTLFIEKRSLPRHCS
jgi:hypothetical protein